MDTIQTGGPAFPSEGGHKFVSGNEIRKTLPSSGMTLRDYFAAKAMQAIVTGNNADECTMGAGCAADAYALADAMIEARTK